MPAVVLQAAPSRAALDQHAASQWEVRPSPKSYEEQGMQTSASAQPCSTPVPLHWTMQRCAVISSRRSRTTEGRARSCLRRPSTVHHACT